MRQTGTGNRFTTASAFPLLVFATSGDNDDLAVHDGGGHQGTGTSVNL